MKNKHIIISGIALFLITILLLGLTYAYYKTKVIGNNNEKTISSVGKKLEITYADGNGVIEAVEIEPGYTATKTFSVKNTGDDTATYSIKLDNITNTFTRTEDWTYILKEGNTEINKGTIPTYETTLLDSVEIESGVTKSYSLTVTYANLTDVDQSIDMGSTLSIRVNIGDEVKNSVTFIGNGNSIENYRIYGNSIQRGIPTPDNPVEIESVGDKTKNLYPNYTSTQTREQVGITQTSTNGKNTIILNGTSTSTGGRNLLNAFNEGFLIEAGKTYTLSCHILSGTTESDTFAVLLADKQTSEFKGTSCRLDKTITFTATETYQALLGINILKENVTFDNVEVGMMIEEGTTASEYEPYGYKIPVTVSGKNLISPNYTSAGNITRSGVTIKLNDGLISFTGTTTEDTYFILKKQDNYTLPKGIYTLTGGTPDAWLYIEAYNGDKRLWQKYDKGNGVTINLNREHYTGIRIFSLIKSGKTVDNLIIKPQIEEGNVATEYKPYIEPVTTNIYLDEPLRKVGDYADYIDFKEQKIVRTTEIDKINDLKGDYYGISSEYPYGFFALRTRYDRKKGVELLSNIYQAKSSFKINKCAFGNAKEKNIYIVDDNYTNLDNLKNDLKDNKIYYALETPKENNITLPNIQTLEGTNTFRINTNINPSNIEIK